jgi:galactokinase
MTPSHLEIKSRPIPVLPPEPQHSESDISPAQKQMLATAHIGLTEELKARSQRVHRWFVPGRLEFLGKHTDYCGGRSILGAIDRGFGFCAAARPDSLLRILDVQSGQTREMNLASAHDSLRRDWTLYPATVAKRLAGILPEPMRGADVAFISDLPPAAGLSSSSCLIVGFYLILAKYNSLAACESLADAAEDPLVLGDFLGHVESGRAWRDHGADTGVGTHGGSQDHTAILCSAPGRLTGFDFYESRTFGSVALPDDLTFVIAVSGISAHKAGNAGEAYNRVSRRAYASLRLWRELTHRPGETLEAIFRSGPQCAGLLRSALLTHQSGEFSSESLLTRVEQYHKESHIIIPAALAAMRSGDWPELGRLVDESQRLADTCLHNQVPQTRHLAASARKSGALAASAFGAGFGGAVWALVEKAESGAFIRRWKDSYEQAFPELRDRSSFFAATLGQPAMEMPAIDLLRT